MNVKGKRWYKNFFLKKSKEVLSLWPTGKEVVIDEAIQYQKGLSDSRRFVRVLRDYMRREVLLFFQGQAHPFWKMKGLELEKRLASELRLTTGKAANIKKGKR